MANVQTFRGKNVRRTGSSFICRVGLHDLQRPVTGVWTFDFATLSYSRTGHHVAAGARPIRHDGKEPERPVGSFGQARMTPLRELQLLEA